jgi:hypothetical protein
MRKNSTNIGADKLPWIASFSPVAWQISGEAQEIRAFSSVIAHAEERRGIEARWLHRSRWRPSSWSCGCSQLMSFCRAVKAIAVLMPQAPALRHHEDADWGQEYRVPTIGGGVGYQSDR